VLIGFPYHLLISNVDAIEKVDLEIMLQEAKLAEFKPCQQNAGQNHRNGHVADSSSQNLTEFVCSRLNSEIVW